MGGPPNLRPAPSGVGPCDGRACLYGLALADVSWTTFWWPGAGDTFAVFSLETKTMRQTTINHFPFSTTETETGEKKQIGGTKGFLPGSFRLFRVNDIDDRVTDEGCGYSLFFIPVQSISPREGAKPATGILQLVKSIYAEDGALDKDGKPLVLAQAIVGAPLVNRHGFPVSVPVERAAKWRDAPDSSFVQALIQAAKRNFGSHDDSDGKLCYGSGMPESVTRPVFIRAELDAAREHAKRYGHGEAVALENCRYVLNQRKDKKAPHATWDRYLTATGEIVGVAQFHQLTPEGKKVSVKKTPTKK